MTYEEVVKAHECCSRQAKCMDCPLYDSYGLNCISVLRHATVDLLHSQKAEIERLKTNLEEAHIDIRECIAAIDWLHKEKSAIL